MIALVGNPVYGFLYKHTVGTFAGAFLVFNVWVYALLSILVSVVNWRMEVVQGCGEDDEDLSNRTEKEHEEKDVTLI